MKKTEERLLNIGSQQDFSDHETDNSGKIAGNLPDLGHNSPFRGYTYRSAGETTVKKNIASKVYTTVDNTTYRYNN